MRTPFLPIHIQRSNMVRRKHAPRSLGVMVLRTPPASHVPSALCASLLIPEWVPQGKGLSLSDCPAPTRLPQMPAGTQAVSHLCF